MHLRRTKFDTKYGNLIAEFLPPVRQTKQQKVILILTGMPGYPSNKALMLEFAKKGFWVFCHRYAGSWESSGQMFRHSPHLEVPEIIAQVKTGFADLWNQQKFSLPEAKFYLIGNSFGGPSALLNSNLPEVKKIVAIASVINWQKPGPDEPIDKLQNFTEHGFGSGYRINKSGWTKILSGKFYNPVSEKDKVDFEKCLFVHAKDDCVCPYNHTLAFIKNTSAKILSLKTGGHLGSSILLKLSIFKKVLTFIKQS